MYYLVGRYYVTHLCRLVSADSFCAIYEGYTATNLYVYCGNNPIGREDPSGCFWRELLDSFVYSIEASKSSYGTALVLSQTDSPAIGPLDLAALAIVVGTTFSCAVSALKDTKTRESTAYALPSINIRERAITAPDPEDTVIYRYGPNIGSLLPSRKDVETGTALSFSTIPKPNSWCTTINLVNSTGILEAIQDGTTHVSVYPIGGTISEWRDKGTASIWTQTLAMISMKIRILPW